MFEVRTQALQQTAEEMNRQSTIARQVGYEVEAVRNALQNFSGYGDLRTPLNRIISDIQEQEQELKKMSLGLEKISMAYDRCENRICDNADGYSYSQRRVDLSVRTVSFEDIKTINISL